MKTKSLILALLLSFSFITGCTAATGTTNNSQTPSQGGTAAADAIGAQSTQNANQENIRSITVSVGEAIFEGVLADNEAAQAFYTQLPLTIEMADYAKQEKTAPLPFDIPATQTIKPETIQTGEIYLWSGNQLVLFNSTFTNGYGGYVPLGAVSDAEGLTEALGNGNVTVTIAQSQPKEERVLTAYFSCTGNTAQIAEMIAAYTGADLFQIIPEIPYTTEDLNYGNPSSRSCLEQNEPSARPAISGIVEAMEAYDIIFLGYPIWWGQAPKIICTFLESYDFSGKTIVPFCTSGSSGIGSSAINLQSLLSDSAHWMAGERFSPSATAKNIGDWIEGMGILTNKRSKTVGAFDFETKTVLLNSGYEMPILGLGTYSLADDVCVNSVASLLESGGRLIDTAYMYHNEESVGQAVRASEVPREEIFITTKLYPNQFSNAETAIEEALAKLDVDYIDLMLLHHPGTQDAAAYQAMEKAVAEGKIRSIGLSNWYVEELEAFLPQVTIMPAVVQNEIHPYYQENDVIPFIQEKGIVVEGWYPLGGRGHTAELLNDPVITEIAKAHDVTSAQVILRWNLQKGVVVIPGSSNPDHIKENLELFDFSLTEDEMARINALDRNEKHDWY